MIRPHAAAGMPIADVYFTTNNGTVVKAPLSDYAQAEGGNVTLDRGANFIPVTLAIAVTNEGSGPLVCTGLQWTPVATPAGGIISLSYNGINHLNNSVRFAIPPRTTQSVEITYSGTADGIIRGDLTLLGVTPAKNTRVPFTIDNIRITVNTII